MGRRRLGGARGAGSGNIRDLIESTYGHLLDVRHRSSAVEYRETEVVQLPTARRTESAHKDTRRLFLVSGSLPDSLPDRSIVRRRGARSPLVSTLCRGGGTVDAAASKVFGEGRVGRPRWPFLAFRGATWA